VRIVCQRPRLDIEAGSRSNSKVASAMDFEQSIVDSWHANADAWTDLVRNQRIESRRVATDAAIIAAILQQSPRRVLDVGCGEGWLARQIAACGVDVTGFDVSPSLIARAREYAGRYCELGYADFAHAPTALGTHYDVVVCNFSLLAEDIAPLLRGCRAVIAPSGKLVIQTVHPFPDAVGGTYADGWREETFASFDGDYAPMPWYFRTVGTWVAQVTAAGFHVIELREPAHPEAQRPLSLLLIAAPVETESP
jgi:2-polyprenyl-3-methyl-5-hydroxy-6-metoxy-1,4-benzoquinol methylase